MKFAGIADAKYKVTIPGNIPPTFIRLGGEKMRLNAGSTLVRVLSGADFAVLERDIPGVRIAPASLQVSQPVTREPERAREEDGTFRADDPSTAVDEAWVDGNSPDDSKELVVPKPKRKRKKAGS